MNKSSKKKIMIGFFAAIALVVAYIILSKPALPPPSVSVTESTVSTVTAPVGAPIVSPVVATPVVSPVVSIPVVSPVVSTPVVSPVVSTPVVSPVVSTPVLSPIVAPQPASSEMVVSPIKIIKPRQQNIADMGYLDKPRGWYDMQNQGVRNDYCRWVGNYPSVWFSCALAGSTAQNTPNSVIYKDSDPHDILPTTTITASNDVGLFDENGYYSIYPDVKNAGMNAKVHYCLYGYNEGRSIKNNKGFVGLFDKVGYYTLYPDVKNAGMDALKHFCDYGFKEGRSVKLISK